MVGKIAVIRHPHPQFPRLSIQLRPRSRFYQAVTYLDRRLVQKSLKTEHLTTAFQLAVEWYRRLLRASEAEARQHPLDRLAVDPTIGELYVSWSATLPPLALDYAKQKWSPISAYWRGVDVTALTAQTFRDFFTWRRRQKKVKPHTLHKDVILIRQVLKHAIEEGHLAALPPIPKVGGIIPNPRPWLTPLEWKHLVDTSVGRQQEALTAGNPRLYQQRLDTHELAVFMVLTMVRVNEALALRFGDCTERRGALLAQVTGKRGTRTIVAPPEALAIIKRRHTKDASKVFPEHHRDGFRELLKAAGLYRDAQGFTRNYKSLRATSISFKLLDDPSPNLLAIARNAGTSVSMIDQFYARRLSAEMHLDVLSRQPQASLDF